MSINPQRRAFLRQSAVSMTGLTGIALASSLQPTLLRGNERTIARSVIFLYMSGGPSQVDTFDPKPALATYSGQNVPESIARNVPPIKL